ncbi:hypothetical protein [Kribbella sp. NPDC003557]|uniref:hypothetical protein n=1 Tax=Kribbella sp. NPDC003557 TaxID=3154449 RepID=UPI0033AE92E5
MTRVLVADRPSPVLRAVREAVVGESELELEPAFGTELELMLAVAELEPDLVVVSMSGRVVPPLAERLLDEYPRLMVLALDVDHSEGLVQTSGSRGELIEDLYGERLREVLKSAVG